jgi:hypothetical protein
VRRTRRARRGRRVPAAIVIGAKYGEPNAISNPVENAKFPSRSHDDRTKGRRLRALIDQLIYPRRRMNIKKEYQKKQRYENTFPIKHAQY